MISTVKAYFKRVMQDVGKSQKKQLEEARKEGFREGMQRQRELLQTNLVRGRRPQFWSTRRKVIA